MFRRKLTSLLLFAALVPGSLLVAQHAQAHQCVEALILRSPEVVYTGETFPVSVGMFNCGSCDTAVNVNLFLVRNNGRIHIGAAQTRLRTDTRDILRIRCTVPRDIRSGRYDLVMAASTQSGYMDLDRRPILVLEHDVHRRYRDLDLVIDHVLDSYGDSLDENGLADMVDDLMSVEVGEGDLGKQRPKAKTFEFTGKIVKVTKKDGKIVEIRVENALTVTETFVCDGNTDFVDGEVFEGDRVKVTYKKKGSKKIATEVDKV